MAQPFFTIITPTYNRAKKIGLTIESVLNQKYQDFEYIIVDDGSTDLTEEVVRRYADPRIKYIKKKNEERGAARNFGVFHAGGKYINFLDSDDLLYDNHLDEAHKYLNENGNIAFFYQAYETIDEQGNLLSRVKRWDGDMMKRIAFNNFLCPIGAFFKAEIIVNFPFDEDRKFIIAEDLFVWLRIGARYGIPVNTKITSALVNHEGRTMALPPLDTVIYSADKMISLLEQDVTFMEKFSHLLPTIQANHYSLAALSDALRGGKRMAIRYLFKALIHNPRELLKIRSLAIIKHLLIKF